MTDKVYVVGLTGPTGSGKSEVARVFKEKHFPMIDADILARRVVEPGQPALAKLVEEFSEDILNGDGTLNRRQLAKRAFATPEDTAKLNAITHPYILELSHKILMQFEQMRERLAVIDAPLLFESGMDQFCDLTVAVVSPAAMRLERIRQRDGLTVEQACSRMAAQQEEEYYTSRADIALHNEGDLALLRQQAAELAAQIQEWAK